ncbi:SRPBCC domain-containing protein [Pyruvatibacter sp.]|uniref:SRPBCC family protein n=1 Tax=Pyruvatibacter sp. TaxID=1981328 RepID=UPI0032667330
MTPSTITSRIDGDLLKVQGLLEANQERVYEAWTRPADLLRWFGPRDGAVATIDVDLRVGGRLMVTFASAPEETNFIECEYLELEPPQRLSFTWTHVIGPANGARPSAPTSEVSVSFHPEGAHTRFELIHRGLSDGGRQSVSNGWTVTTQRCADYLSQQAQTDRG